ncbi:hypothetical protein SUGI_0837430 [Cryptomeria japonica]|nr:hypothetical protein SUGI_0837430 [Cryptomeria japonica]
MIRTIFVSQKKEKKIWKAKQKPVVVTTEEPLCLGWTERPKEYLPNIDTLTNHANYNLVEPNEENIDKEIEPSMESNSDSKWMSRDEMDKNLLGITNVRNINQSMVNPVTKGRRDGRAGGLGILRRSSLVDIVKEKSVFWDDITQLVSTSGNRKIIIGGDFNTILDLLEKMGGSKKVTSDMLNFRNFVQKVGVTDCKPSAGWFTWNNKRSRLANIVERLDRFLIGSYWSEANMATSIKTLPYCISGHFPVQLEIGLEIQGGSSYFKF